MMLRRKIPKGSLRKLITVEPSIRTRHRKAPLSPFSFHNLCGLVCCQTRPYRLPVCTYPSNSVYLLRYPRLSLSNEIIIGMGLDSYSLNSIQLYQSSITHQHQSMHVSLSARQVTRKPYKSIQKTIRIKTVPTPCFRLTFSMDST